MSSGNHSKFHRTSTAMNTIREYTINPRAIWDMNLASRYSQRFTALLSSESAMLEYTNYLHMAIMSTRKDEDNRREMMIDVLQDVDARFHDILYDWDGDTHELTDVKTMMEIILNP